MFYEPLGEDEGHPGILIDVFEIAVSEREVDVTGEN